MVVGENKRTNIMDGIENTGDVRLHDHRLRLKQRFDIVRKLGQGTYGKVQLGINKKTGQEVAIKTIKKCKIESDADLVRIRREVQIMSSVRHPNIVHIYEVFENSEKMILVMEYCSGGELYDYLSQKKVLEEDEARRLFRQIATAVYYCHIHKICHRDLKLENVLLDDTGSAKIADFGLSNVFKETSLLSTFCGSPLYASPEIVKGTPYIGPEVDCWSLGVLLYTLVYGAMPFDGSNFKRLVRQISNGDYYEPKSPSSASPLIRDMLTVDPLKRADIAYICDHSWVNAGCEISCLEKAEALAAETPVRLDLLLSLAPAAPSNSNTVVVPSESGMGGEDSCTDLTSSTSMAVEPSNSAEKRILELVAEGGEDAIKPSPTRTIVSAGDNKRKLELAMSASGMQRKKERVASSSSVGPQPALAEEASAQPAPDEPAAADEAVQPQLTSSATITIAAAPGLVTSLTKDIVKEEPKEVAQDEGAAKPRVAVGKKTSTTKVADEKSGVGKQDETKLEEAKPSAVSSAADKLTSLSLAQPQPLPQPQSQPQPQPQPPANQTAPKPKKLIIAGGNVGSFKEQFERRASLTAAPDVKRTLSKPVVSKIAKPKAQSEDRELQTRTTDNGTVRLQQIGIEPSPTGPGDEGGKPNRASGVGVLKTESEPSRGTGPVDPSVLLQDARRSLQSSMAKLVEEKAAGEDHRRRAARDIISTAIRTGKPPVPYGRSSSAGVGSLSALGSPPAAPPSAPGTPAAPAAQPHAKLFRTEAHHRVEDHRNRGVSVERIIPIHVSEEAPTPAPCPAPPLPKPAPAPLTSPPPASTNQVPLRRLVSTESTGSEAGEPIKKSAREFIIPIAVEGKGYVTPRQRSLEPDAQSPAAAPPLKLRAHRNRLRTGPLYGSLVSGGESDEDDDTHSMHRLRSSRAARAESVSSGEEDEEDEGFHRLTADNLFSTLLHRVRALTQSLNGEEGPGFSPRPHSLFNNLQSPFFNSPHLPRRHQLLREGWGSRDLHADFDSMFGSQMPRPAPRGNSKKSGKHQTKSQQNVETNAESGLDLSDLDLSTIQLSEKEMRALSGLTPALSRRLQQQLLAHLPPAAARSLRRTLSLHAAPRPQRAYARSHSATKAASGSADLPDSSPNDATEVDLPLPDIRKSPSNGAADNTENLVKEDLIELSAPQFCTLPRLKRHSVLPKESTPPISSASDVGYEYTPKIGTLAKELSHSRGSSIRSTPERPLLSKYLTPERNLSLDESYSSDSASILSEPSYIAAYGTPGIVGAGTGFSRRHSMRLAGDRDVSKKRVSRFLRPDFFDTPPDESLYAKHKKEKELETQKILKEIREKRNKASDASIVRSPIETNDVTQMYKEEASSGNRLCLSPLSLLMSGKERSRSVTPFFPILDNIKETTLDTSNKILDTKSLVDKKTSAIDESPSSKESKLTRPKSYPVKNLELCSTIQENNVTLSKNTGNTEIEDKNKNTTKESKLMRPKSYPTSNSSPEKVYVSRNVKRDELKSNVSKEEGASPDNKTDIEVSFSISLPRKKPSPTTKTNSTTKYDLTEQKIEANMDITNLASDANLTLKKYQVIKTSDSNGNIKQKNQDNTVTETKVSTENSAKSVTNNIKEKSVSASTNTQKETPKIKTMDSEKADKKGTVKKKIIKKVSSKTKVDGKSSLDKNDTKEQTEKKKIVKKVKSVEDNAKPTTTIRKKKSVLQSIGQKFEKFASSKSSSPDKVASNVKPDDATKISVKLSRTQREQSVPVTTDAPIESKLIKRAVTVTDVAALDSQVTVPNKTAVSKVLGLFKKFEPKDKSKISLNKRQNADDLEPKKTNSVSDNLDNDKPRRPTSLLLNGLGRKVNNEKSSSDNIKTTTECSDQTVLKKENEPRNLRNSLKLDFSRLPRVKKIVPTNPVIEPQIMDVCSVENDISLERNNISISNSNFNAETADSESRSRSRSRSNFSNSDYKSDHSVDHKVADKNPVSPCDNSIHHPIRNHESTTPDKEDIVDRIRRKSFYSRFNEKKQRRKSSLVGPGATEYDPIARIHSQPTENKYDLSPTSPSSYDLSPGFSVASDVSPSTERYRTLIADLSGGNRSASRYDSYGINDRVDTYRSLDRSDLRKYSGSKSYLDYDQPSTYVGHRYSGSKSLLDSCDENEDRTPLGHQRDPHKYNRTISMYSPGNYATYRPKRTRNSAIILKEGENEPSPENILDKIRQRKNISISVTRKPDIEKNVLQRPNNSSKGEDDGAECSQKTN